MLHLTLGNEFLSIMFVCNRYEPLIERIVKHDLLYVFEISKDISENRSEFIAVNVLIFVFVVVFENRFSYFTGFVRHRISAFALFRHF